MMHVVAYPPMPEPIRESSASQRYDRSCNPCACRSTHPRVHRYRTGKRSRTAALRHFRGRYFLAPPCTSLFAQRMCIDAHGFDWQESQRIIASEHHGRCSASHRFGSRQAIRCPPSPDSQLQHVTEHERRFGGCRRKLPHSCPRFRGAGEMTACESPHGVE